MSSDNVVTLVVPFKVPFHNLDVQTMNEYQMAKSVPGLPILQVVPLRYTSSDGCIIRELLKVTIRGVVS